MQHYTTLYNTIQRYTTFCLKVISDKTNYKKLREQRTVDTARTKLTIRQKTLKFSGATLYNSLPRATRQSTSLSSFKIRAYQYFLDTYI